MTLGVMLAVSQPVRRNLTRARGRGCPKYARQRAADIHLIVGQIGQAEVPVGGVEAIPLAEVMVHAGHVGVAVQRGADGREESLRVVLVARQGVVGERHVFVPELLDDWVKTEAARVAAAGRARRRLVCHAVYRNRSGVEVIGLPITRGVRNLNYARPQELGGRTLVRRRWKAAAS